MLLYSYYYVVRDFVCSLSMLSSIIGYTWILETHEWIFGIDLNPISLVEFYNQTNRLQVNLNERSNHGFPKKNLYNL